MKKTVPFKIDDENEIFIEVEDINESTGNQDGIEAIARKPKREDNKENEENIQRFDDAIKTVKPASETLVKAFLDINGPSEIAIEFGLKFNVKAGAIIASVNSEATFKISLKWKNEK